MEYKNTLYEKNDGIATITINRPKALNTLNKETILELIAHFNELFYHDPINLVTEQERRQREVFENFNFFLLYNNRCMLVPKKLQRQKARPYPSIHLVSSN